MYMVSLVVSNHKQNSLLEKKEKTKYQFGSMDFPSSFKYLRSLSSSSWKRKRVTIFSSV
jgi:hypothetical protein